MLVSAKLQLAPKLFKYQPIIIRGSSLTLTPGFNATHTSTYNLSVQWSVTYYELTATLFSADATKAKQPCFTFGSRDHAPSHSLPLQTISRCSWPSLSHLGHTVCGCAPLPCHIGPEYNQPWVHDQACIQTRVK